MNGLARFLTLTWAPLWERFRQGEGALLAVNAALVWYRQPPLFEAGVQLLVSAWALAALYAVNDWHDAEADRRNPRKNPRLVAAFLEERQRFGVQITLLQGAIALAALALLGPRTALAALALFGVNAAYSGWLKGVPFGDLLIVGAWGAAYSALVSSSWRVCLVVGLMTSMMHAFQVLQDREVDAANRIRTTAVRSGRSLSLSLAGVACALYGALWGVLGPVWSLSAFLPLVLQRASGNTKRVWMWSRVYCGVALLATLEALRGQL